MQQSSSKQTTGFIGAVERIGNRLPDPVFIFVWLTGLLMLVSVIAAVLGLQSHSSGFGGARSSLEPAFR